MILWIILARKSIYMLHMLSKVYCFFFFIIFARHGMSWVGLWPLRAFLTWRKFRHACPDSGIWYQKKQEVACHLIEVLLLILQTALNSLLIRAWNLSPSIWEACYNLLKFENYLQIWISPCKLKNLSINMLVSHVPFSVLALVSHSGYWIEWILTILPELLHLFCCILFSMICC
jgi:hypothetical protein